MDSRIIEKLILGIIFISVYASTITYLYCLYKDRDLERSPLFGITWLKRSVLLWGCIIGLTGLCHSGFAGALFFISGDWFYFNTAAKYYGVPLLISFFSAFYLIVLFGDLYHLIKVKKKSFEGDGMLLKNNVKLSKVSYEIEIIKIRREINKKIERFSFGKGRLIETITNSTIKAGGNFILELESGDKIQIEIIDVFPHITFDLYNKHIQKCLDQLTKAMVDIKAPEVKKVKKSYGEKKVFCPTCSTIFKRKEGKIDPDGIPICSDCYRKRQ
jgi:hypothetical protein